MKFRTLGIAVASGLTMAAAADANAGSSDKTTIELNLIGSATVNITPPASAEALVGVAEISTFDPKTKRLFVVDGSSTLRVFDLSDPTDPTQENTIDVATDVQNDVRQLVAEANSVDVKKGLLAVAIAADPVTDPGYVAFYNTRTLAYIASCVVGALPDMVTFTNDGSRLLVANEGEPEEGIDPEGSISILDVEAFRTNGNCVGTTKTVDFTDFNGREDALRAKGVRIFPKKTAAEDLEPEYIAVSKSGKKAWVVLQEANAMARINVKKGVVERITSYGLKDHSTDGNGLDASDRDDGVNIQTWPVYGMYMPDAIASFGMSNENFRKYKKHQSRNDDDRRSARFRTFLITANEGDARDEDVRIGDLTLDPVVFPGAATLQEDGNLGRLQVSAIDGNSEGEYQKLHSYGSRSFSIWNHRGRQVYDSGDDFARMTSSVTDGEGAPLFNSEGTSASFDGRSDNKGAEPEGVDTGKINGRTYAFIGLERIGGVMVYDVSKAWKPKFVQYVRRDEDISPEGIKYIHKGASPTGKPLLVVSHEESGTIAIYEIETIVKK